MLTILHSADLYTPRSVGTKSLVLGGGRVLWIGDEPPQVPAALVAEEIDLDGARVIPGLVDLHAHPTGGGGEAGPETRVPAPGLSSYTRSGITSVVGLLGTDAETRSMASLLAEVRALRRAGLGAWCYTGGYHLPPCTLTGSLRGDIVHLEEVIGVGELALSDFRSSQLTLDELLRVASEAQVGGMLTGKAGLLHLHLGDGPRGLELVRAALETSEVPARLFHPTHVNRREALLEEAFELTRSGCSIDLTAGPVASDEPGLAADQALARYLDAGLSADQVSVSSDSGGCLPVFDASGEMTHMDVGSGVYLAEALRNLFKSGRSPEQFLPAFTSNPARLAKLPGRGVLQAGAAADLVLLDEDASIHSVMVKGRWHMRAGVALVQGPFESSSDPA
ncbi:MAG TPA: beta-aspartyl-peptidase [Planctomycetota bacterium]|nr:beta-aspartyl-peptidase [Planctomycetota bacterium]